jgi:hypothetical protein
MKDLWDKINYLKNTMTSVSTGGQRIQDVNEEYKKVYRGVNTSLVKLKIDNPNPYSDLWEWYGKWSSGEMPQYRDRRTYLINLFKDLLMTIESLDENREKELEVELEGWDKIERLIGEIKNRLNEAQNEEQFQAIGLLCRETIISLAQEVYDKDKHPTLDGVEVSNTDAKRMLDAYIAVELSGEQNENLRKHLKSTLGLANELTHKRTADRKDARLCSSATINLVNIIRIINDENGTTPSAA